MKTVIANLKLYLPNRYFWTVHVYSLVIFFIILGAISTHKNDEQIITGVFINLPIFLGFLAGLMQIDIFNKPVSFCLPGHRQVVKQVILIITVIASLILAYIAAVFIFGNRWSSMVIPLFFVNIIFFLLGAWLTFFTRNALILIWFIIFGPSFYIRPYEILGGLIIQHPIVFISIGMLCCILIWLSLNISDIHRKFCAVPQMPIGGLWNREKLEKYQQFKLASKKGKIKVEIKPSVERYFLNKMNSYKYFNMGRYIWGNLYKTFGPLISNFHPLSVLIIFAMLFAFCYSRQTSSFALFMYVLMLSALIQLPVHSTLLISDGRKEKFYSALGLSISYTLFILLISTIMIILTNVAEPFMPDYDYSGHTYSFHAISYTANLLPIIIVPLVLTFKLFFYKRLSLLFITIAGMYGLFIAFFIILDKLLNFRSPHEFLSIIVNPVSVVFFIFLLWVIFMAVLRRVCFKRSLV